MASSNHSNGQIDDLVESFEDLQGSLLEIYVFSTDRQGWKQVFNVLVAQGADIEVTVDDEPFDERALDEITFDFESSRVMRANVAGAEWTSTLYREDQVDLQLAPEDFQDSESVRLLLLIVKGIADATGRRTILIPETPRPEEAVPLAVALPQ